MQRHELLRKYRELRGFTQKEIAEKLGMTHSGYSKYERGDRKINFEKWFEIIKILNVPYQFIDAEAYFDGYEYEETEQKIFENQIDYFESIDRVVKIFIDKKDSMSDNEKKIAKELFEDVFYSLEKAREADKKARIKNIEYIFKEKPLLADAIKTHDVEFLYDDVENNKKI